MSLRQWDDALRASARTLRLGVWRLDFQTGVASWDAVAAELLNRGARQSTQEFVQWLEEGVQDEGLPNWAEDQEWRSTSIGFRTSDGPRCLRFEGRRSGFIWEGSLQDITEQRMLRERVAQAERMEAIGEFSAGVAHNFNNMLAIIVACLGDAEERLEGQENTDLEILRDIQDAQDAAQRASVVVENMGRLSHADGGESPQVFEVQPLCAAALEGLRRIAVNDLQIIHSISPELRVRQIPGVLEQALSNLLVNANYAVKERSQPTVWLSASQKEDFGVRTLELVVGDNGGGVPPEVEPFLFRPFVSSKGEEGTGLGLATASESLRRIGGQLVHRAREGGGAEFVIVLPLVSPSHQRSASGRPVQRSSHGLAGRNVLVVDDEPVIRRMLKRILEQEGATVDSASDLASAREQLRTPSYDAVLLDQTLGRERGNALVQDIRRSSASTRILFFSGEPVSSEEKLLVDGVIAKPIAKEPLLRALLEVIAQRSPPA